MQPNRIFLGAGVAVLLGACHAKTASTPPPAPVVAGTISHVIGSGSDALRYPVEATPRYSTAMSFRVAGKLVERKVRLGDAVHRGQLLARLDRVDAEKQAVAARAAFDAADHRLAYARQQLDRDRAQAAQNLISALQLEQTEDAYAAAKAGQSQAASQRTLADNALAYTDLVAERDGLITSENADTGDVVSAGQPVFGLAWSGETDVNLDAAASDLARMRVGHVAEVTFAALSDTRFAAKVREIAPAADPQSRTYRVKLTLVNPSPAVRFGMTGDAVFAASSEASAPVYRIPATAIFHAGAKPAVWLIRGKENTLELRPVEVKGYGERYVTVTQGLTDGDRIVETGVHTVFAGQAVKPIAPLYSHTDNDSEAMAPAGTGVAPADSASPAAAASSIASPSASAAPISEAAR